jgi:hypothetical protein
MTDLTSFLAEPGTGVAALAGVLVVLALLDSISFGTLLIPVWLLMSPGRPRPGRVLTFLATVAVFYLGVGIAIMLGAGFVLDRFGDALTSRPAYVLMFMAGAGLLAASFALDSKRAKARAAENARTGGGRINRWRARAMGTEGHLVAPPAVAGATTVNPYRTKAQLAGGSGPTSSSASGASPRPGAVEPAGGRAPEDEGRSAPGSGRMLMVLALSAGAIEVATMLPYLAGIGLITANGPGMPGNLLWLAGYCLVMITPALVLVALRVVAARLVEGPLRKLDSDLTRTAATTTAWVVGIVGVLLALHASAALGWR